MVRRWPRKSTSCLQLGIPTMFEKIWTKIFIRRIPGTVPVMHGIRRWCSADLDTVFHSIRIHNTNGTHQCWGSGMFIPDPRSWFLPIPDPGSKNSSKREGWKKISFHTFFCSHKFDKIENYFIFEMLKKKIWANFQRIIELFTQKIVSRHSKDGFGIRDPGVKKAPDPGSGSATLVPPPPPTNCV